jgi:hypothetical protein
MAGKRYCSVSIFLEFGISLPGKEIDMESLKGYIKQHIDLLNRKNIAFRKWYNESDGKTYIDISALVSDQGFAIKFVKKINKIALFNWEKF